MPRPAAWRAGGPRVRAEVAEGLRWLLRQRMLRTMAILIGLLNVTLAAATAVLVLLAKERLHVGSVGYGSLFTCMAVGSLLGSAVGDRVIRRVTATWTIRIGLLVEALTHLTLALATNVYVVGAVMAAFGIHAALWTIVGTSLRQRLTPAHMLGRVSSANLFISAGGNCRRGAARRRARRRLRHHRAVLDRLRRGAHRGGGDLARVRPGHGRGSVRGARRC